MCVFANLSGVPSPHAVKDALDLVRLPYKDKKLFSQYSPGMMQHGFVVPVDPQFATECFLLHSWYLITTSSYDKKQQEWKAQCKS